MLEAYRMFANSKGWLRRMEEDIARGLSAEAAVEKEHMNEGGWGAGHVAVNPRDIVGDLGLGLLSDGSGF